MTPDNEPLDEGSPHLPSDAGDSDELLDSFVREAEEAFDEDSAAALSEADEPDTAEANDVEAEDLESEDAEADDADEPADQELTAEAVEELQRNLREFADTAASSPSPAGATAKYRLVRTVEIDMAPPLTQPLTMGLGGDESLFVIDRPSSDRFRVIRVPFVGGHGEPVMELENGSADNALLEPVGIAVNEQGRMHIPDAQENCIKVFSPDGRWLRTIATAGEQGAAFDHPRDVDVADDGHLYIADTYNNRVVKLTGHGELVWEFEQFTHPQTGDEDDELYEPASVCISGDTLAIADTNQSRIVSVGCDGEVRSVLDSDGSFEFPSEVRITEDGTLYIADCANLRVQRFTADGTLDGIIDLRSDDSETSGGGDIDIDADGNVVMIDPVREAVVVLGFVDPWS